MSYARMFPPYSAMNDVLLRRRVEYYLELVPNRLDTQQGRMLVSQIRWLVVVSTSSSTVYVCSSLAKYQFHAALESATIRYAILGLALGAYTFNTYLHFIDRFLEHVRRFLQS